MLKLVYPCKGLLILIEQGFVVKKLENIDEKGLIDTFYIKNGDKEIMIRHCPCCGEHIQNVITPEGECFVEDEKEEMNVETFSEEVIDKTLLPYQKEIIKEIQNQKP